MPPAIATKRSLMAPANSETALLLRQDVEGVAILTINRPNVLNALNSDVLRALSRAVDAIECDTAINAAVITGAGQRAFVAGADIKELAQLKSAPDAEQLARDGQQIFRKIELSNKPFVAALNGLAFGGGCELAMACHTRIAVKDLDPCCCQPEPKLGIIPGYGATQRLPRWVGIVDAWRILRTAQPLNSSTAQRLGLIEFEVPRDDLLQAAARRARAVACNPALGRINESPLPIRQTLTEIEIGPLSRKIDDILCQALMEGSQLDLEAGLEVEAKAFGRCVESEDFRIGVENFLANGPKVAAKFVHR